MNNLILSSSLTVLILSANTWADGVVFTRTTTNRILVSGIENTGPARGPVVQLFGGNGNLLLSRFVLNRDFRDLQVFAANTNSITGKMTVVEGLERTI
jgi:hypothetical protein